MTIAESLRQEARQEGWQEGRQEGRQEGLRDGALYAEIRLCSELLNRVKPPENVLAAQSREELEELARSLRKQLHSKRAES